MRNIIILFFIFKCIASGLSQNLVINPGFEDTVIYYNPYNSSFLALHNCRSWKQLNTANYYWFKNKDGIRGSKVNEHTPHSGQCFAGIYTEKDRPIYNRECVVGTLKNSLSKACLYKVKLYLSFSNQYALVAKNIDVLLSEKPVFYNDRNTKTITLRKGFTNEADTKNNWILYEGEYKANGTENFISIGYFHKVIDTEKNKYRKRNSKKHAVYTFIDDVMLLPLDSCHINKQVVVEEKGFSTPKLPIQKTEIIQPKRASKSIYFSYDNCELNPSSIEVLNSVVDTLKKNNNLKVKILGYADKHGTESYNLTLSKKRATSVSSYLMNHDIEKHRISYCGKGIDTYSSDEDWRLRKVVIHFTN